MSTKTALYLDDVREPHLLPLEVDKWIVVRNYNEFVDYLENNGFPDIISFDHDLGEEHYNDLFNNENWEKDDKNIKLKYDEYKVKTGYHAAKYLISMLSNSELSKYPEIYIHSANPVGSENIRLLFNDFGIITKRTFW